MNRFFLAVLISAYAFLTSEALADPFTIYIDNSRSPNKGAGAGAGVMGGSGGDCNEATTPLVDSEGSGVCWKWSPTITVPAISLRRDNTEDSSTLMNTTLMTGLAGGAMNSKLKPKYRADGTVVGFTTSFSYSVFAIISGTNNDMRTAVGGALGFLDNKLMVGAAYDLGDVDTDKESRLMFMIGFGTNFLRPEIK